MNAVQAHSQHLDLEFQTRPGNDDTLTVRLAERRISPDVIETFDIRSRGDGWTYRTPNGAIRWKNANPDAENKYAWISNDHDSLLYLFDLKEAVEMAGGVIWLTTEFDYFAMRSAGIYHVIAQIQGESSVPADLPSLLQGMGVLACYIAPDRDEAGERWAQKVANALVPAGIGVIARALPGNDGYDLGDAWREYTGKLPFERWLLDLPNRKLKAEYADTPEPAQTHEVPQDYRQAIANALGIHKFNAKGYSKPTRCIFHDDQKPSAGLHREYGLHCFVCGWHTWKELGQALGLGRWQAEPDLVRIPAVCLSTEALQALVKSGSTALARLLSASYGASWETGREFTAKDVIALGLSTWTAYQALQQAERAFFGNCGDFFFTSNNTTKTKKRYHRQAKTYRLPAPAEVNTALNVTGTHYTPIDGTMSAADFRAELYSRPIKKKPGKYARKWLCDPLGIHPNTASNYDKRAGIEVTPNVEVEEITDNEALPEHPERKPVYLLVAGKKFAATKKGYECAVDFASDERIMKITRQANTYRLKG